MDGLEQINTTFNFGSCIIINLLWDAQASFLGNIDW